MLTTQPNKKCAENRKKNACKLRKQHSSIWQRTRCKCSQHNVVLCAFSVCFFICLCCEHLHHLLSNWWKYFLNLLVLFLFACVFLSSLGHRRQGGKYVPFSFFCWTTEFPWCREERWWCRRQCPVSFSHGILRFWSWSEGKELYWRSFYKQ